jgi:hypothetical protein
MEAFPVPKALAERYVRTHGGSLEQAGLVVSEYQNFMLLKKNQGGWDATTLSPPFVIDRMWHLHLWDPKHYVNWCYAFCGDGNPIGYDPDEAH